MRAFLPTKEERNSYIPVAPYTSFVNPKGRTFGRKLSSALAKILNLPRTASAIVRMFAETGQKMKASEVVRKVKRSERSVRKYLVDLVKKGILQREIVVTAKGKLAYLYSLRPIDMVIETVKKELAKKSKKLDELSKGTESI